MNSINREARLVMPIEATTQSVVLHKEMAKDIARAFGGYTSTAGHGGWVDDERLVEEAVVVYDIAMPQDDATKLRDLALRWGKRFNQKAVYVRYPSGTVDILDVNTAGKLNAAEQAFLDRTTKGAPSVTSVPAGVGERVFGTKRLPKVGEVWATRCGGQGTVLSRASILDGGFNVERLTGPYYTVGDTYIVNLDGRHLRDNSDHPLDLVRYVSSR